MVKLADPSEGDLQMFATHGLRAFDPTHALRHYFPMLPVRFDPLAPSVPWTPGPRVASTRRRVTALALLLSVLAAATEVVRNEGAPPSDGPPVQLAAGALPDASRDVDHEDCACLCACSCDLAQVAVVGQAMAVGAPALESFFRPVSPRTSAAQEVSSPPFRPPPA